MLGAAQAELACAEMLSAIRGQCCRSGVRSLDDSINVAATMIGRADAIVERIMVELEGDAARPGRERMSRHTSERLRRGIGRALALVTEALDMLSAEGIGPAATAPTGIAAPGRPVRVHPRANARPDGRNRPRSLRQKKDGI